MEKERMDKACVSPLEKLQHAVEKEPDSPLAHLRLGSALIRAGFLQRAEQSFRRSLELDPNYAEAWVNLGGVLHAAWDFGGCVEANKRALECNPGLLQAHYNQGLGYLYLGQAEDMLNCFGKVIEIDSSHPGGHYHLAVALYALGEVEKARENLSMAIELGYSPQPEFVKAIQRDEGGDRAAIRSEVNRKNNLQQ
ncbi:MAG: tetratricopeptide repeat protein [Pseudomonadota bacterium]